MGKTTTPKKRAKRRTPTEKAIEEIISSDLTERSKLFCLLYTTDAQCFGNASRSYIHAYDLRTDKQKKSARQLGYKLLTNVYIKAQVGNLFKAVFTSKGADNALAELINQRKDLNARLGAIREFNKLKNRVKDEQPKIGPITIQISKEVAERQGL